jgi:hypothetical protein
LSEGVLMALSRPIWLQNQTYSARLDRTFADVLFTEGIINPGGGDFEVSERGTGPNNTTDIAVGIAVVEGDDETSQGKYVVRNDAVVNLPFGPAPTSDARIDLVILEINDATAGNLRTPADLANLRVIQGVVDPSPVTPAVPDTAIALAEVLRTSGDSFINNSMITDLRAPASQQTFTVNSRFEALTTAQRNALTPFVGQTIFNTDAGEIQFWDGTSWGSPTSLGGLSDVDLVGLADGDFLQYDNATGNWLPVQVDPIPLILALA